MKEFPISALAQIIKAKPVTNNGVFTGVSINSWTTKAGDCFFAIPGENFDGHDYVADAFAKGAVCAVVSKDIEDKKSTDRAILKVNDTIKALGDLGELGGSTNRARDDFERNDRDLSRGHLATEFAKGVAP